MPYKQRVGGSNPSTPTRMPKTLKISHFEGFLFAKNQTSSALQTEGRGRSAAAVRIPQLPQECQKPSKQAVLRVFYLLKTKQHQHYKQRVGDGRPPPFESLNSHKKDKKPVNHIDLRVFCLLNKLLLHYKQRVGDGRPLPFESLNSHLIIKYLASLFGVGLFHLHTICTALQTEGRGRSAAAVRIPQLPLDYQVLSLTFQSGAFSFAHKTIYWLNQATKP